ncbi:MAG: SDR family NAD(P)-dependent oxidoreductase [Eubacteriaceae bacterium]
MEIDNQKFIRVCLLMIFDVISLSVSFVLSNILIQNDIHSITLNYILIITFIKISCFYIFGIYSTLWKYASVEELFKIILLTCASNILLLIVFNIFNYEIFVNVIIIMMMFDLMFVGGSRLLYRFFRMLKYNSLLFKNYGNKINVLIVGAGDCGVAILKEIKNQKSFKYNIVGFVDDSSSKIGAHIAGIKVLGSTKRIVQISKKYAINEIIIAMPSVSEVRRREILQKCKKTKCKIKTLPVIYDIINGKVKISQIRDIQIEDLLGREEISLDANEISKYIHDKKILITGGGGSIGSELCRQVANLQPKTLMLLDIYENNAYEVQQELKRKCTDLDLKVTIASVRDKNRIDEIVREFRPDVVFHAAAHKHVPLMEENPKAAIKNNVFGTLNIAQACDKYGTKRFVLISTDKAVNPTNIMGASKRLCEMIIQSLNEKSKTEFVAVRFGNVLGSNGSVIPLFKKQIALGGPVTVTHPNVIRYFMSIREAVQLVLQAGSMARGGEVFVLDMGKPVKIVDLAKDLIKLSGFKPGFDIQIEYVGLRPGEKLYEELLLDEEGIENTPHEKIFVGKPNILKYDELIKDLERLKIFLNNTGIDLKDVMMCIVPTYKDPDLVNSKILDKNSFDEIATTLKGIENF